MNYIDYELIESKILDIENKLEIIFNSYTNDDFEYLVPVPFIYKRSIRFVPTECAGLVRELLSSLESLEDLRVQVSTMVKKRVNKR